MGDDVAVAGGDRSVLQGGSRIEVRSIGSAGLGMVRALHDALGLAEAEIARRLFQAPTILLSGLEAELAERLAGVLRGGGLEVEAVPDDTAFAPGDGTQEVALDIRDFARMPDIIGQVVLLLGVTTAEAMRLVCAVPAVLMGQVSSATAARVTERFAPLGVDVLVSSAPTARFTCIVDTPETAARLAELGWQPDPEGLCRGLDHDAAREVWTICARAGLAPTLLNEDFARYDVMLRAAPDSPEMRVLFAEKLAIQPEQVPRLLAALPLVLRRAVPHAEAEAMAAAIAVQGGSATLHLLAQQRFAVALRRVTDAATARQALQSIGGLDDAETARAVAGDCPVGRMTSTQARWLQYVINGSRAGMLALTSVR